MSCFPLLRVYFSGFWGSFLSRPLLFAFPFPQSASSGCRNLYCSWCVHVHSCIEIPPTGIYLLEGMEGPMPHRDYQNTETKMSISLDSAERLFYATRNFLVRAEFGGGVVGLGHF